RGVVILVGGEQEQPNGLLVVLGDPPAGGVHLAQTVLARRVLLIGGLLEPAHGLGVVLRHAAAVGIERSEARLGFGVPLIGRAAIPLGRLGRIGRQSALAELVGAAEPELGARLPLVRRAAEPLDRLDLILRHALAVPEQEPQVVLPVGASLLGRAAVPGGGLGLLLRGRICSVRQLVGEVEQRLRLAGLGRRPQLGERFGGCGIVRRRNRRRGDRERDSQGDGQGAGSLQAAGGCGRTDPSEIRRRGGHEGSSFSRPFAKRKRRCRLLLFYRAFSPGHRSRFKTLPSKTASATIRSAFARSDLDSWGASASRWSAPSEKPRLAAKPYQK